jgi:dUTP pyrophosphatase
MQLKIKLNGGVMPKKANKTDAGYDLTVSRIVKKSLFKITYGFGLSYEIPNGFYCDLRPRSSVHKTYMILSNCCGVGDAGYRGEVMAVFYKLPFISKPYKVGQRALQLIPMKLNSVELMQVETINETERGNKGYGSSGK